MGLAANDRDIEVRVTVDQQNTLAFASVVHLRTDALLSLAKHKGWMRLPDGLPAAAADACVRSGFGRVDDEDIVPPPWHFSTASLMVPLFWITTTAMAHS